MRIINIFLIIVLCCTSTYSCNRDVNDLNAVYEAEKKLSSSIEVQNVEGAKEAIQAGIDINRFSNKTFGMRTDHGVFETNPLRIAMFTGCMDIAHLLLDAGADVNYEDKNGVSLLQAAVEYKVDFIDDLISYGADVNKICRNGNTALEYAIKTQRWKAAEVLLGYNPVIRIQTIKTINDIYNSDQDKARMGFGIYRKLLLLHQTDNVDLLLKAALISDNKTVLSNKLNDTNILAVEAAAAFCQPETLKYISGSFQNCDYNRLFSVASLYGNNENLKWMLENIPDLKIIKENKAYENSPIQLAATHNNAETVKYLLAVNIEGNTELMCIQILEKAAEYNNPEIIDIVSDIGMKCLYASVAKAAIEKHSVQFLKKMIVKGLDVNSSVGGKSLLEIGCLYNDYECVKLLVDSGANVNNGEPLALAARNGNIHILSYLIENGASINGYAVFDDGSIGNTALISAVIGGHLDCVIKLVDSGADIMYVHKGENAIERAEKEESDNIYNYLKSKTNR